MSVTFPQPKGVGSDKDVSTEITLKGAAEIGVGSMFSSINGSLIDYFLRDIKSDADYHYISVDFVEEKEENEYVLIGVIRSPHGSDVEQNLKVLNYRERLMYDSFCHLRDFLINER